MKNYNKNKELLYLMYLDENNLQGWPMSQKLPVGGSKWKNNMSKFNEKFIKNYDENSDIGHTLKAYVEYPKRLHNLHSELPFLAERIKIKKCSKLACNLFDKKTMSRT